MVRCRGKMSSFLESFLCSFSTLLQNRTIGRRKVPAYVLLLSISAATGGLMFGYDIGVSGGVTVMDDFLCQFFPGVLEEKIKKQGTSHISISRCKHISMQAWQEDEYVYTKKDKSQLLYCIFGDQKVQLFTSSLYMAAMVATFFAGYVSKQQGRKMTIILSSVFYLLGVAFNIASGSIQNKHHAAFCILIFGRIMLGVGVGFGNQAIPLFISEIAPTNARGSLNHLFQLNITIGIFFANIVNWKAHTLHPWGWRLALGLAGVPALLLTLGSFVLIVTPKSFTQGLHGQAHQNPSLVREQGVDINLALHHEGDSLNDYTRAPSMKVSKKLFNGLFTRSNMPPLLIAIFVQFFQQFTGINVVMLYAPVLFTSFGSGTDISLVFVLIIGSFNVVSTIFSILVVDRIGRRRLLLAASGIMFFAQLFTGILLIHTENKDKLEEWRAILLLLLICAFVGAFACSWGPLGWLISTEIFPMVYRSEGQSVTVFFNMLFTFMVANTSLSMLCTLKYGIFVFYAIWVAIMGFLSFLFLPETMNIDIDLIVYIWSYHKFWKHFVKSPPLPPFTTPTTIFNQPQTSPFFLPSTSPTSPFNKPQPSLLHLDMSNIKRSILTQ